MSDSERYVEFLQEEIAQGKVQVSYANNPARQISSIEELRSIRLEDIIRHGAVLINGTQIILKCAGTQNINSKNQIEVSIEAESIPHLGQYMQTATLYDGLARARIPITNIFSREFHREAAVP